MDAYAKLKQMLATHPAGAPAHPALDEILALLFTPGEAALAVHMNFAPRTPAAIAAAAGVPEATARTLCESLADKGVVYCREKAGERSYALLPTVPGLFEFPLMAGAKTPVQRRLAELWKEYHDGPMGLEFAASQTPFARVIPVEQTVAGRVEVLPHDVLSAMMDKSSYFALAECACRVLQNRCGRPTDTCLVFDSAARFLVGRGLAREITRGQAAEVLARAEKAALVHTTNNSADRLSFICNCCGCCCTILRGRTHHKLATAFAPSRYAARVDTGLCAGCGLCAEERCPVGAMDMEDGMSRVNETTCIGCGLCATTCPQEAVTLFERAPSPSTPATMAEMGLAVATEKGRLTAFLDLMKK